MNMMAFKNSKQNISQSGKHTGIIGNDIPKEGNQNPIVTRSFSVNRAFGKDITNKVLNQSGAAAISTT